MWQSSNLHGKGHGSRNLIRTDNPSTMSFDPSHELAAVRSLQAEPYLQSPQAALKKKEAKGPVTRPERVPPTPM